MKFRKLTNLVNHARGLWYRGLPPEASAVLVHTERSPRSLLHEMNRRPTYTTQTHTHTQPHNVYQWAANASQWQECFNGMRWPYDLLLQPKTCDVSRSVRVARGTDELFLFLSLCEKLCFMLTLPLARSLTLSSLLGLSRYPLGKLTNFRFHFTFRNIFKPLRRRKKYAVPVT